MKGTETIIDVSNLLDGSIDGVTFYEQYLERENQDLHQRTIGLERRLKMLEERYSDLRETLEETRSMLRDALK
jgi:chaperonin cofactor prefoldin